MNYFSESEIACRCHVCVGGNCKNKRPDQCFAGRPSCNAKPISKPALAKMNKLRELLGEPIILNSACRCEYWNNHEDGSKQSQHKEGMAFDIRCSERRKQSKIAALAEKVGFGGIFFYNWGVHVDDGPSGRRGDFRTRKGKK